MSENLSDCVLPPILSPLRPLHYADALQERASGDDLLGDFFRHVFRHLSGAVSL